MYLRHKSLDAIFSVVRESIESGSLVSGQFVKVGFDDKGDLRSFWVFVPDFSEEKVEEVKKVD